MKTAPLKNVLAQALERAGGILRRHFGKVPIQYKGLNNIVTQADLESQSAILGVIRRHFPSHDWNAEEKDSRRAGSDFLWLVDPLDGTTNYAHGLPVACVSIAVLYQDKPLLAGIYDPFRNECFTAELGQGARLNGKPIHVSKPKLLQDSLLITGFPYDRAKHMNLYLGFFRNFLTRCHDVRRYGSAALDMAWIAAGRADGYWEFHLSPWDVGAGLLLVTEAGGKVTDYSGKTWNDPQTFGRQTLASNGKIHDEMLAILRKAGKA